MAADPQLVEATKTLSSTMLRVMIPVIIIGGAVAIGLLYIRLKIERRMGEVISRWKMKKARQKGDICPQCGGRLVRKNGKFGVFFGCINYPRCKFTREI